MNQTEENLTTIQDHAQDPQGSKDLRKDNDLHPEIGKDNVLDHQEITKLFLRTITKRMIVDDLDLDHQKITKLFLRTVTKRRIVDDLDLDHQKITKVLLNQAVDRTFTARMIVDNRDLDHQKITKFPRKNIDMSEKDQDLVQRTDITHTKARINPEIDHVIDHVIVTIIEDSNCDFI